MKQICKSERKRLCAKGACVKKGSSDLSFPVWAFAVEREGQTAQRLSEISPIVPQATPALAIPSPTPPFSSQLKPQGHLWVNLAQPWPENRVISYSSNPLLSHHAIKYALQPLTSQVRTTPPPSSNTTLPTPTEGPIKKRKVRIVWKQN